MSKKHAVGKKVKKKFCFSENNSAATTALVPGGGGTLIFSYIRRLGSFFVRSKF